MYRAPGDVNGPSSPINDDHDVCACESGHTRVFLFLFSSLFSRHLHPTRRCPSSGRRWPGTEEQTNTYYYLAIETKSRIAFEWRNGGAREKVITATLHNRIRISVRTQYPRTTLIGAQMKIDKKVKARLERRARGERSDSTISSGRFPSSVRLGLVMRAARIQSTSSPAHVLAWRVHKIF